MSRAGYRDDYDGEGPPPEFWYRAIENAIHGKRGQQFMRDLRDALDAIPTKRLIASELRDSDGEVCALGSVGVRRGVDMSKLLRPPECDEEGWEIDWECDVHENSELLGSWFNIAPGLAREVMFQNDDGNYAPVETPEHRWVRMRNWVAEQLGEVWKPDPTESVK